MTGFQHPRDLYRLDGVAHQARAFEDSLARGRLHHAWMLTGPKGLGKAGFAFRAARRLLGARADESFGPLGASPDDPVSRLIASQSHPDLLVLERGEEARKVIPVDEARRLPEFFSKAPALGPYRVAIIDAVDDFNANGANAVLKTLEEPSARGVLLLVSHAPGRLLPTVRSRCRTLAFRPWSEQAIVTFVESKCAETGDDPLRIAAMAGGSPGRAAALIGGASSDLDRLAYEIVTARPDRSNAALMKMSEGFRGGEGMERFAFLLERLCSAIQKQTLKMQPAAAAKSAALWERLAVLPSRVEGLNLDRTDAFWAALEDIRITLAA
jgi:DNA polymerase-3 subunit delta'